LPKIGKSLETTRKYDAAGILIQMLVLGRRPNEHIPSPTSWSRVGDRMCAVLCCSSSQSVCMPGNTTDFSSGFGILVEAWMTLIVRPRRDCSIALSALHITANWQQSAQSAAWLGAIVRLGESFLDVGHGVPLADPRLRRRFLRWFTYLLTRPVRWLSATGAVQIQNGFSAFLRASIKSHDSGWLVGVATA